MFIYCLLLDKNETTQIYQIVVILVTDFGNFGNQFW